MISREFVQIFNMPRNRQQGRIPSVPLSELIIMLQSRDPEAEFVDSAWLSLLSDNMAGSSLMSP